MGSRSGQIWLARASAGTGASAALASAVPAGDAGRGVIMPNRRRAA